MPDELGESFQLMVPGARPVRKEAVDGHGDREVLAAIVFVATPSCTWQQLPSVSFGPSGVTWSG
ncbi:hypothetical protein GCM10009601_33890 [Streptomyces thermospinosisporus]|uniref:Transposase n=1 Tax=Streptomyces thermospinosisporus TaxID=161482 RepID=A0ABP4JQM7_9ACTN